MKKDFSNIKNQQMILLFKLKLTKFRFKWYSRIYSNPADHFEIVGRIRIGTHKIKHFQTFTMAYRKAIKYTPPYLRKKMIPLWIKMTLPPAFTVSMTNFPVGAKTLKKLGKVMVIVDILLMDLWTSLHEYPHRYISSTAISIISLYAYLKELERSKSNKAS